MHRFACSGASCLCITFNQPLWERLALAVSWLCCMSFVKKILETRKSPKLNHRWFSIFGVGVFTDLVCISVQAKPTPITKQLLSTRLSARSLPACLWNVVPRPLWSMLHSLHTSNCWVTSTWPNLCPLICGVIFGPMKTRDSLTLLLHGRHCNTHSQRDVFTNAEASNNTFLAAQLWPSDALTTSAALSAQEYSS